MIVYLMVVGSVSCSVSIDPSHLGAASSAAVVMTAMGMAAMLKASILKVLGRRAGLAAWAA